VKGDGFGAKWTGGNSGGGMAQMGRLVAKAKGCANGHDDGYAWANVQGLFA